MSNDPKGDQALALIAALQTILDALPETSDADGDEEGIDGEAALVNDPTHELFVDRFNQATMAGLFTSIRIIHNIHNLTKVNQAANPAG